MSRCCARRPNDGVVDRELIERAVRGEPVALTNTEMQLAILLHRRRHGSGLTQLASHFNYSRSAIGEMIARLR